jgi:hypothetical protein
MVKKSTRKPIEKKSSLGMANEKLNKEIDLEQEHPGEVIKDELEFDKKHPTEIKATVDDQKSSRLLFTTVVIVGVILMLLIIGTQFLPQFFQDTRYTYNGFEFVKNPEMQTWFTTFRIRDQIYPLPFHYGPRDLEDIPTNIDKEQLLNSEFIYLSLPPMEGEDAADIRRLALAAVEVGKIIGTKNGIYDIPTKAALTRPTDEEDTADIPIIGCGAATETTGVIIFQIGSYTSVYENSDNCYIVQGPTGVDVLRASDRFVYELLGIMLP